MMECARLYLSLLTTDTEGIYHIHGTTTYEGSPLFDDSLTDLTMIRTLFSALVRVLPEMEAEVYAHVLEKLPPFHTTKMDEDEQRNAGLWGQSFVCWKTVWGWHMDAAHIRQSGKGLLWFPGYRNGTSLSCRTGRDKGTRHGII